MEKQNINNEVKMLILLGAAPIFISMIIGIILGCIFYMHDTINAIVLLYFFLQFGLFASFYLVAIRLLRKLVILCERK